MYPEYEDGIEGITYTIDGVANDFFDDVEFGYTTVYFADVVLGEGEEVDEHVPGVRLASLHRDAERLELDEVVLQVDHGVQRGQHLLRGAG